jgi:PAS domain S-box-containing protein
MEENKKNNFENIEKYFKLIVENSLDIIVAFRLDGEIVYITPSIERITGYRQEELSGKAIFDYINPEDQNKAKETIENAVKNPSVTQTTELRILRKDGSWMSFQVKGHTSSDSSGVVIVAYLRNLTDKKELEEKINAIFDQTSHFFCLISVAGILLKANKTALQLAGVKESDVLDKPFWETAWWAHSKDLQEKVRAGIKRAANGENINFEANHQDVNKELHYFDFHLKPFKDGTGKVTLLIAESFDVTARKNLQEQIVKEKQEQEAILDSIPALIFYKDRENHFIHVNLTYSNMIGIPKKDLEGKSGSDIFPKEQSDKFFEDDKEVIESGKAKTGIIEEAKFPDGNHWVRTDKIPFKDEKGNAIGIIGFAIDITESKKAEVKKSEYLEELEKFRNLMIGRELKMIELKEKITELEAKLKNVSKPDTANQDPGQAGEEKEIR